RTHESLAGVSTPGHVPSRKLGIVEVREFETNRAGSTFDKHMHARIGIGRAASELLSKMLHHVDMLWQKPFSVPQDAGASESTLAKYAFDCEWRGTPVTGFPTKLSRTHLFGSEIARWYQIGQVKSIDVVTVIRRARASHE